MSQPRIVATVTLHAARELKRPEESAAAYHVVRVPAGSYPVELRTDGRGRYLALVLQGTVTASGYGSTTYPSGGTDTLVLQPYKYELEAGRYLGGSVEILDALALATAAGV